MSATQTKSAITAKPAMGAVPAAAAKTAALSPQEKKIVRAQAKVDNFKKLAVKRVNKVIYSLNGVAALANRNSYTYAPDQIAKIFAALDATLVMAKKKFESPEAGGGDGFTL